MMRQRKGIEVGVLIGEIPSRLRGAEVVVVFGCKEIRNNGTFYTDSNGLEMRQRILNHRANWDFYTKDPVSSNYYPINTAIAIRDTESKL